MVNGWPVKVSCGVGVNSVAMLVGMKSIGFRPDAILFADTGSEMPATYAYIPTLRDWLARVGFPDLTVVKNASPIAGDASLYDECVRKHVVPSISYGFQRHSCAEKWKIAPQEKWCRSWDLAREAWSRGDKVWVVVGYDAGTADERRCSRRYANMEKRAEKHPLNARRFAYWYPLQKWGWDRATCVRAIEAEGLPVPVKSSCLMCGARTKPELVALAESDPGVMAKALFLESNAMPRLTKIKGLGCKFNWNKFLSERFGVTDARHHLQEQAEGE